MPAVELAQYHAGNRPGHDGRGGERHEEQRRHLRPLPRGEPQREVEQHAGREAGFEHPDQKAQQVELCGRGHEHHRGGGQPPQHHDAQQRAPDARARQQQVAGQLEQRIPQEEDARAQAEHGVGKPQPGLHLQLRIAHVAAVQVVEDVADEEQRHQAPGDAGVG
jgi:hypothetical protein